jgi:restriction system protein
LREDKTARIERIPGKYTGFIKKTQLPDTYEFSVGKYTRSGNIARNYSCRILTEQERAEANAQTTYPFHLMTGDGYRWWWYLNRFWRDDENLLPSDIQALVLSRERRKQATLERAHASLDGGSGGGNSSDAVRRRLLREEAQERDQRRLRERAKEVRLANEQIGATVSALERLLIDSLDERDVSLEFERGDGDAADVSSYFSLVLDRSEYPEGFPKAHRVAFVSESRQLVVEYELPTVSIVPATKSARYVKSRDAVDETARPQAQIRTLYGQVVAQVALRTLHELFQADGNNQLETIVLNGYVDTTDPATGQPVRPHLVTVRTSKETFEGLNLRQVDPFACLRGLKAGVSRSPAEMLPVRPIVEFDMVDPRFIEESDVLGALDNRPNLMELSPKEFESLISNLFERMGLDTRQTQASRDGGVDCVAWDSRPIFGGKVIIQAKRYKHTVGVSAVRDLYGTMQNEGASKGILVTTSGYGRSSFEFADGKPLELLSGSNLLYLLAEHAGIDARIEAPEDWVDPTPDIELEEPAVAPPGSDSPAAT